MGKERASRNRELARGVNALGRSAAMKKKGRWVHSKKGGKPKEEEKEEAATFPKWYSADDVKKPIPSRKANHKPTRLRASITPGTILIVLAGRFRGKRVVFLKQLESGLLLVTGPYKINGVPIRRLNQAYVIATSTKIDVSGVDVSKINDDFFKRPAAEAKKGDSEEFFKKEEEKKPVSAERKDAQKKVDSALSKKISKELKLYLNAKFSLTRNDQPHLMKF